MSDSVLLAARDAQITRWQMPSVGGGPSEPGKELAGHSEELVDELPQPPTVEEIAQWEAEARSKGHEEGYAQGHGEGCREALETGRRQVEEKLTYLQSLIESLETPFKQLDDQVEQELRHLVVAIAQQLVRREIRAEPGEIIGLIRESMALLPANQRRVSIHLHPEDAELLRDILAASDKEHNWDLVEEPLITRGGCRIGTEVSHIDATLESRLASLAAAMLGGEREGD